MGSFLLAKNSKKGWFVISLEAILNPFIPISINIFADSSSKGVDKNSIPFFLQYFIQSKTLFPRELFNDTNYIGGLIFIFLFGLLLVPPFILMPDFLSNLGGYPIDKIGLILTTSGIGGMAGTFIASRILSFGYFKTIMVIGLLTYMVGQFYMTAWNKEVTTQMMMINGIIRGIGIGLFYPALATITYVTLPQKLRDHGASLYQFTRNAGSAVAIAIIVILSLIHI